MSVPASFSDSFSDSSGGSDKTIWYTRCPVPTAFGLAARLGWITDALASHGIAFKSLAAAGDASSRQSHFEHTQPDSFRHGGNIPALAARSRGADVRLIGLSWTRTAQRVLAGAESGIETIEQLAGRKVSIPRRLDDTIDFWRATVLRGFEQALATAGMTLGDVKVVEVPVARSFVSDATKRNGDNDTLWDAKYMLGHQREEVLALARGDIDAIYSEGAISEIVQGFSGARVVFDFDSIDDTSASSTTAGRTRRVNNSQPLAFTVSGTLADGHPDVLAEVVLISRNAAAWARENERDAKRLIAAEVGLPEELVDTAFSPNVHRELGFDLSQGNMARLQIQHDHLRKHGFISRRVDLDAFALWTPQSQHQPHQYAETQPRAVAF
ncbi:ABC transporter substrate-binding protein [soil metagenome]